MSEHTVTAVEPAWVEQEYEPTTNGVPDPVSESTTLHSDGLDELFHEAVYTCSCGDELNDWGEVTEHFKEVTDD